MEVFGRSKKLSFGKHFLSTFYIEEPNQAQRDRAGKYVTSSHSRQT